MRLALGVCRLLRQSVRSSPRTPPSEDPELEPRPTAELEEDSRGKRNALTAPCPYCGEIQDPPPKRKKKCRACGKSIRPVMRGGRRRLLTEDAYARLMRQEEKAKIRALRRSHSKAIRGDLRRMRASGITQVQVLTAQDERVCAHCMALEGKTFSIEDAQSRNLLSGDHCDEGYCRCVYLAVIPGVSRISPPRGAQRTRPTCSDATGRTLPIPGTHSGTGWGCERSFSHGFDTSESP